MTQTIIITSGKGGVGKTTISVNTAIELAQRNYRTCLMDADLGLANVNILLGLQPEHTLDDYIFGDKTLDEIILQTKFGIDIIPGSSGIEKIANLDREEIAILVSSFGEITGYDFFLIDTSSGISRGVLAFCLASSETIIVITAEATSLTDAYALLKVMSANNYSGTVKILVNRSPDIPKAKETYLRFKTVVNKHLNIHIAPVGLILSDPNIERAISSQQPALTLFPDTLGSHCIKAMVSNLLKKNSPDHQEDDFSNFWKRYFDYAHPKQTALEKTGRTKRTSLPPKISTLESIQRNSTPPPVVPVTTPRLVYSRSPQPGQPPEQTADSLYPPLQCAEIIDPADLLPPIPILAKALAMQARGEIAEDVLFDIFCNDPVLMVKALKMLCSRNTGAIKARRLTSKKQLLEVLGRDILVSLLNTTAMQRLQRSPQSLEATKTENGFWFHCYQSALIAEKIAEITAYSFPEEAFIAGLIHDIGRLTLQTSQPQLYRNSANTFGYNTTLVDLEKRHWGMSHAEVGARALRSWQLDNLLVDAVQYHNEPFTRIETALSLVKIVYLASRLCTTDIEVQEVSRQGKKLFGLSTLQMQKILTAATQEAKHFAKQLGILQPALVDDKTTTETETRFRQQLMDNLIFKNVLPPVTGEKEISEIIFTVSQAFNILFSFQAGYILLVDHQKLLKAIEFPGCFGADTVEDIQFSLQWQKSMVVQSYINCDLKMAIDKGDSGSLPLADRQLLHALGTHGFVCVPLATRTGALGVLVFGITASQVDTIKPLKEKLLQFGYQAARNIPLPESMSVKDSIPRFFPSQKLGL